MKNKMKTNVQYINTKYFDDPKTGLTVCLLTFTVNLGKFKNFKNIINIPGVEEYLYKYGYEYCPSGTDYIIQTVKGYSKCAETDTYDKLLGRNIALTRAQKNAFKFTNNLYDDLANIIYRECLQDLFNGMAISQKAISNSLVHDFELTK